MGKATALAPANIAFIKYWGARDLERVIPWNASVSMTLERCHTRSTVVHEAQPGRDALLIAGPDGQLAPAPELFARRALAHLDAIRRRTGAGGSFRVATQNSFPSAAGLASSASGFMALTLAAAQAVGLDLTPDALSRLARESGSGSAARSAFGGYVLWAPGAAAGDGGGAVPLAPAGHWDLRDVIAIVDGGAKAVSSLDGHRSAPGSPLFPVRQGLLPARLADVRQAISERDLAHLGPILEEEAIELHLVAMSSRPPIFYWRPGTLGVLEAVRTLRQEGTPAWSTMDAGPNVHVICEPAAVEQVAARLAALPAVEAVIRDGVGPGPRRTEEHLF